MRAVVKGYGMLTIGSTTDGTRKNVKAHRVAFEAYKGPIPAGLCVCHQCDNPLCVNPDHLFLGTAADNVRDREQKKRHPHLPTTVPKLTADDVRRIRYGGENMKALSKELGVHYQHVYAIRCGKKRKGL